MARHRLPSGSDEPPLPDERWNEALLPYAAFLAAFARASHRLEFWESLRDGRRDWLAFPGLVVLSPACRWMLRHHLRHPDHALSREEGPAVLFLAVAYVEFWAHEGLGWGLRYLWRRAQWDAWAQGRAGQLMAAWLAWPGRIRQVPGGKVPPGKPPL